MKQNLLLRNILNKVFQKVLRISYIRIISLTLLTIVLTSYKTTANHSAPYLTNIYIDASLDNHQFLEVTTSRVNTDKSVLHLFSHGKAGQLFIDNEWKDPLSIGEWIRKKYDLSTINHINIYGCEFAKGETGLAAVKYLEQAFNKTIAASDDITGRDGDWDLEVGQTKEILKPVDYLYNLQTWNPPCCDQNTNGFHLHPQRVKFKYLGSSSANIQFKGKASSSPTFFSGSVNPNQSFIIDGTNYINKHNDVGLTTDVEYYVNGSYLGKFHASCSQLLSIGDIIGGLFEVEAIEMPLQNGSAGVGCSQGSFCSPLTDGGDINGAITNHCNSTNPGTIPNVTPPAGGSGGNITYKWQKRTGGWTNWGSWTDIPSTDAWNYNPPFITESTQYRRLVRRCTNDPWLISTSQRTFIIEKNPTNGGTISGGTVVCTTSYNPPIITENTPPDWTGGGGRDYRWQYRTGTWSSWSGWITIPSATSIDYDPPSLNATRQYRRGVKRPACPDNTSNWKYSNNVTFEFVQNHTDGGTIAADEAYCNYPYDPANIVSVNGPSGGCCAATQFQWQESTDNASWTNISGATSNTYDPPTINVTTYYRRGATITGCPYYIYSNVVTKAVLKNYTYAGKIKSDEAGCYPFNPSNMVGDAPPDGGSGGTKEHQWQKSTDNVNWTDISGATNGQYNPNNITQTTYYRRGVRRHSVCPYIYSNVVTKTVLENYTYAGKIKSDEAGCSPFNPSNMIGDAPPDGGSGGTKKHQWQKSTDNVNWTDISGATNGQYNPNNITQTTYYRRGARRHDVCPYIYSNVITKTVIDNYTSGGSISGDESKCGSYDPSKINSTAGPNGGQGGTKKHQWQKSTDNINWTDISGATSEEYNPNNITQTTYYRRGARRSPCSPYKYTNVVTKAVTSSLSANASPDVSICDGNSTTITASASGGSGSYDYTWNNGLGTGQSHIVSPTTTATYTVTVTDLNNNCTATDDVTVTVIDNYSNGGIISGGDEKCDEIDPSFISNASGPGGGSSSGTVEYRWEYRTGTWNNSSNNWNWSSSWNIVPGANSQDYTTPLFYESRQYKRGAKKTVCSQWKYSNSVTFTVVKNYSYEGSISGDESKCGSYDPLMINSTADPSGGQGGTLEIIWESKVNGGSWTQISNANGLIYDPLTINETTYYRRGARRSPCSPYKYTNVVTKAVTSSLSANASPDVSICDGNSTTITASASGGSGSYDYTWNNGLGTGQSHIVSPITTTTYTVTVTDLSNNCTATDQVTVTVMSIPNITGTSSTDEICSSSNGSITIYFTDDPNRSAIEFSIDGGSSYLYSTPDDVDSFVISNLSAGPYNLYARWSGGDCPISQGSIVIKNYFHPNGCNPEVKFEKTINVDTAMMQETVFYTFTISNNAGGVLDNVTFVDMLTYGGLFFSDPFDMTNGIQVLGQTINQNSANLTLNNIPVGISTFKLTVDIPANLVQWSTYCNQASIGNLQASNPNLPSDNILSDDPSTPTVGDPTCVLVKIYENCCNGTDDDGDGLADCDDSDCN